MWPAAPGLLIVAEPSDELADGLEEYARKQAVQVARADHRAAAGRLTVRRGQGSTMVEPACPMFIRLPVPPPSGSSQQALFHQAEIRSLVWAAAALTTARVINRPGSHGFGGRISGSTSVLRHRAGLPEREPEVFASHASAVLAPPGESDWWFQHQRSRVTSPADAVVSDRGPYRAGRIPADSQALVACVTGRRVFILGEVSRAEGKRIRQLSRQAAEALGLTFTTMAWRLAGSAAPELGRVNPCPSLAELGDSWAPIRAALLRELCP